MEALTSGRIGVLRMEYIRVIWCVLDAYYWRIRSRKRRTGTYLVFFVPFRFSDWFECVLVYLHYLYRDVSSKHPINRFNDRKPT